MNLSDTKHQPQVINHQPPIINHSMWQNPSPNIEKISPVAQVFQNNAINQDLTTVPGLGSASIVKLGENGITRTDHLIGHFFLLKRDEVKFIELLESMKIQERYAREVARNFLKKFGTL
jgi:hypothetical protein